MIAQRGKNNLSILPCDFLNQRFISFFLVTLAFRSSALAFKFIYDEQQFNQHGFRMTQPSCHRLIGFIFFLIEQEFNQHRFRVTQPSCHRLIDFMFFSCRSGVADKGHMICIPSRPCNSLDEFSCLNYHLKVNLALSFPFSEITICSLILKFVNPIFSLCC